MCVKLVRIKMKANAKTVIVAVNRVLGLQHPIVYLAKKEVMQVNCIMALVLQNALKKMFFKREVSAMVIILNIKFDLNIRLSKRYLKFK